MAPPDPSPFNENIEYAERVYKVLHDIAQNSLLILEWPKGLDGQISALGIAARPLAAGEIIDFTPGENTSDVLTLGSGVDAATSTTWSWSFSKLKYVRQPNGPT
jgi:hypothetical protein